MPHCSGSNPNSNSNRVLGLVVHCSGPLRIKHNNRDFLYFLLILLSSDSRSLFQVCIWFFHQPSQAVDGVSFLDAVTRNIPYPFLGSGS